jgi:hypothetical protein
MWLKTQCLFPNAIPPRLPSRWQCYSSIKNNVLIVVRTNYQLILFKKFYWLFVSALAEPDCVTWPSEVQCFPETLEGVFLASSVRLRGGGGYEEISSMACATSETYSAEKQ